MSPIGRILLTMCDNDLTVDSQRVKSMFVDIKYQRIQVIAIMLGITIKGN